MNEDLIDSRNKVLSLLFYLTIVPYTFAVLSSVLAALVLPNTDNEWAPSLYLIMLILVSPFILFQLYFLNLLKKTNSNFTPIYSILFLFFGLYMIYPIFKRADNFFEPTYSQKYKRASKILGGSLLLIPITVIVAIFITS